MRRLWISAALAGVLAILGVGRLAEFLAARDEALTTAQNRAANLALLLSEYLAQTMAAGDAALRQLALHTRRIGGPGAPASEWAPSLSSAAAGLNAIGSISVVDRGGIIRHSTRTDIIGQSRAREPLLAQAMAGQGDELLVGTPFRSPVLPDAPLLIPIGRRLTRSDGTTEGVLVATFIPAESREFLRRIDVGARGQVWIFHPGGVVLFREPSSGDPIGQPAGTNPIFAAAVASGGTGVLRGVVDGRVMLSGFHTAGNPPMIAAVSLDESEVLANWTRTFVVSAAVFTAISALLGVTLILLNRQVTAKVMAEAELARTQRVEAERLRLANEQLEATVAREQSARRDAEAASALKDQFLMTVSHELRTPLTAIGGWARLLVDGMVPERKVDDALRTIERNARAQTRLIDDLLDVSSVMSGKLRLDIRPIEARHVIENAVEAIAPAANAKQIRLTVNMTPGLGWLKGDPERLQQIVWNLLSNAVKFTPAHGAVTLSGARTDGHVEIVVSDTGAGIEPSFLPHVFERFRQQDGGTTRRYGGLGLGLAIVRSLVELHGGSIVAESDGEGRGATFTVRLPAVADLGDEETPAEAVLTRPTAARPLEGVSVIVVDDDPEALELFGTVLEGAGATVTRARSGSEALDALRRGRHDVLVSDIEMPGMDGYTLVAEALSIAHARGARLAAVAVTAYSRPIDADRSLAAGFQRHVQKPADPATLVGTVASLACPVARSG